MDDEPPIESTLIRSVAMAAAGDLLLFVGLVFVLLGVANFVTDFLKIKGSGEVLVGIAMLAIAFALILRSRMTPPMPMMPKTVAEKKSEDYR